MHATDVLVPTTVIPRRFSVSPFSFALGNANEKKSKSVIADYGSFESSQMLILLDEIFTLQFVGLIDF